MIQVNRKLRLFAQLFVALAGGLLASCASNEPAEENKNTVLPEGQYPMAFIGQVYNQTLSRATSQNSWDGTEIVAIKVGEEIKTYQANNEGKLTSDAPFYWENSNTSVDVTAWYPSVESATEAPTTFTVQADQNAEGGFQNSDFVRAHAEFSFSDQQVLTFNHLPAKVQLRLKEGSGGVTAEEVANATVRFVNVSLVSGTMDLANGTVEQAVVPAGGDATENVIVPQKMETLAGYSQCVQALLVPQQMKGVNFIEVQIGENTHYYVPSEEQDANLQAGYLYIYNVRVNKQDLEVSLEVSSPSWANSGNSVSVTSKEIRYEATDIKPGDFFYRTAAGDWTTSDGGLRKVTIGEAEDGTPTLNLEWEDGKTPDKSLGQFLGVVFQNNPDRMSEYEKSQGWNHGYVLAWVDAHDEYVFWGENKEQKPVDPDMPFYTNISKINLAYQDLDGFRATKYICDTYKEQLGVAANGKSIAQSPTAYPLFYYASIFGIEASTEYAAPNSTSGWYVPSFGQWWDILENLGGATELIAQRNLGAGSYKLASNYQAIVESLNKRLATDTTNEFTTTKSFWTTTEIKARDAFRIFFNKSNSAITSGYKYSGTKTYSRCVLAF